MFMMRSNLVGCLTRRWAGFAPRKICRPSRRRAGSAEVDEDHRADGGREFLFLVADIPNADYFARCVPDRIITESRTVCRGCRLRRRKPHILLIFTIAF